MRRKNKASLLIVALPVVAVMACCGAIFGDDDETPTRTIVDTATTSPTFATASPTFATTSPTPRRTTSPTPRRTTAKPRTTTAKPPPSDVYYANCDAVRAAGAAPLRRGDPGYSRKLDRDGDGVACET